MVIVDTYDMLSIVERGPWKGRACSCLYQDNEGAVFLC